MPTPRARRRWTIVHQALDIGLGERCRRLVHDQHAGILRQRLGDLDALAVGDRERADLGVDVEIVTVETRRAIAGRGAASRSSRGRHRVFGAWPRKMFSATVSSGKSSSSW